MSESSLDLASRLKNDTLRFRAKRELLKKIFSSNRGTWNWNTMQHYLHICIDKFRN